MGLKTFKYRLYPTPAQEKSMFNTLNVCRHFYNMCLEDRKLAYQLEGRSVSQSEQEKLAIRYRQTFPQAKAVFSQTLQTVADDLDKAFKAFFRRVKAGEKPGYPRFKGRNRFHSFAFKQFGVGAKLDGRRLKLFSIGRVAVRWHRPIEGEIKTVRVVYKAGRWFACFACEVPDKPELPKTGRAIGIDVGVSALLTTSEGEKVEHPRFYHDGQKKLRVLQRSLARKKNGGKNRRKALLRVQRQHQHVRNQRTDFAHNLSYALVQNYDRIACEDLKIRNMVRNHHLSKSILDAGWGIFKTLLTNKAVDAGRQVVFVDPAYTSNCCSNCGTLFQDFDLSTRWVECGCGLSLDRDHNAAINILKKAGWDASVQPNAAPLPMPNGKGKRKRAVEATRL
ncbi:MAG: transposase [Anaerolineae bacterium]|nr:transposase [Anaerolineae bacterium]